MCEHVYGQEYSEDLERRRNHSRKILRNFIGLAKGLIKRGGESPSSGPATPVGGNWKSFSASCADAGYMSSMSMAVVSVRLTRRVSRFLKCGASLRAAATWHRRTSFVVADTKRASSTAKFREAHPKKQQLTPRRCVRPSPRHGPPKPSLDMSLQFRAS